MREIVESAQIIFLCLPTPSSSSSSYSGLVTDAATHAATNDPISAMESAYALDEINEILRFLEKSSFLGAIVIKSTLIPGTTENLQKKYSKLFLLHMPEFVSSRTIDYDFAHKRTPLYLGSSSHVPASLQNDTLSFLQTLFPRRTIWSMRSTETECVKLFCNVFYASKLRLFQRFYAICQREENCSYDLVRQAMIQQEWIHPNHTVVPGTEGNLDIGGACLPKDLEAFARAYEDVSSTWKI